MLSHSLLVMALEPGMRLSELIKNNKESYRKLVEKAMSEMRK